MGHAVERSADAPAALKAIAARHVMGKVDPQILIVPGRDELANPGIHNHNWF